MDVKTSPEQPQDPSYEAPQIERVMGPDEVTREVHYAGEATDEIT